MVQKLLQKPSALQLHRIQWWSKFLSYNFYLFFFFIFWFFRNSLSHSTIMEFHTEIVKKVQCRIGEMFFTISLSIKLSYYFTWNQTGLEVYLLPLWFICLIIYLPLHRNNFLRQLALWQKLRHPNIVQFLGVLRDCDRLIFLIEYHRRVSALLCMCCLF